MEERVRVWVLPLSGLPWASKRWTKLPASVVTVNCRLPEPSLLLGRRKTTDSGRVPPAAMSPAAAGS